METSASLNACLSSHQRRRMQWMQRWDEGVHQAPAGARLDGQVHADAQQLARLADAAHVLAVGEALAQSPQLVPVLRAEHVDEGHGLSSGGEPDGTGGGRTAGGAAQSVAGAGRVLGDGPAGPVRGRCRRQAREVARRDARHGVALRADGVAVGGRSMARPSVRCGQTIASGSEDGPAGVT